MIKFLVAEGTPGQKFIVVCLQCLRVKLYHIQPSLSGANVFHSRRQSISNGDRASEHQSADSDRELGLHSDWQTCDCSHETAVSRTELEHWFCGEQWKFVSVCMTENDQIRCRRVSLSSMLTTCHIKLLKTVEKVARIGWELLLHRQTVNKLCQENLFHLWTTERVFGI